MAVVQARKPPTYTPADILKHLTMLVYGPAGSGKTMLIGSAAARPEVFGKVLILAADPGAMTLAYDPRTATTVEIAPIGHTDELDSWYEYLLTVNSKKDPEDPDKFGTIAIDGITDINEMALNESLERTAKADPTADPDMPRIDHHQRIQVITRREIRRFRDLKGFTFLATALETHKTDTLSNATFAMPSLGGKLAAESPAYFDIVGQLSTKSVKKDGKDVVVRELRVTNNGKVLAKDRSRMLGDIVVDPTMGKIYDIISGIGEQGAPAMAEPRVKLKTFQAK